MPGDVKDDGRRAPDDRACAPGDPGNEAVARTRRFSATGRLHYTGPSMTPTMKAGDLLHVVPYGNRPIRLGDVIVFKPRSDDRIITHRVVSVGPEGTRTQGDHNSLVDPWLLTREEIMGRVTCLQRGAHSHPLPGGAAGRAFASGARFVRMLVGLLTLVLRPVYLALARTGILQRILGPLFNPRLVRFARPNGIEVRLMLGNREIGRLSPEGRRWDVRIPYRLVVEVKRLATHPLPPAARRADSPGAAHDARRPADDEPTAAGIPEPSASVSICGY